MISFPLNDRGERTPARIAPKQFQHMLELMERWVGDLENVDLEADLMNYQDQIGWPWRASGEQIEYWNDRSLREWDSYFAAAHAARRTQSSGNPG